MSLAVSACSALGAGGDPAGATVAAATNAVSEGTAIRQSLDTLSTSVASTSIAAQTYVVQRESINAQLLATLRAVVPPTQQIVGNAGEGTPSINTRPELPGLASQLTPGAPNQSNPTPAADAITDPNATRFTAIQTADNVSSDDGCAIGIRNQFSASDSEIYITAHAYNIRAGTVMSAKWQVNGSVVYDAYSFTVEADDDDFCLWFSIDPATVPFTSGNWTVQLIADGTPIDPPATFSIEGG